MEFSEWEPVYDEILADFGYPRTADEQARDRLDELLEASTDVSCLTVQGKQVAIAGAAPELEADMEQLDGVDAIVAASAAAMRLERVGYDIDCMVTDLDKTPATAQSLTEDGTPVAVHAHGDNVPALETHVPKMAHRFVLPTTQARPAGQVRNFGGFTDGDRAAFLADAAGADTLVFPGWRFDDETVSSEKRRKLRWAGRLLRWLEIRRDERFTVLDGWRSEFELPTDH